MKRKKSRGRAVQRLRRLNRIETLIRGTSSQRLIRALKAQKGKDTTLAYVIEKELHARDIGQGGPNKDWGH